MRHLRFEHLEPRLQLSACSPFDANTDGWISPVDVVATIQQHADVNQDGRHTPLDVLAVINRLNVYGVTQAPNACLSPAVIRLDAGPVIAGAAAEIGTVSWKSSYGLLGGFQLVAQAESGAVGTPTITTPGGLLVPQETLTIEVGSQTWSTAFAFRTQGMAQYTTTAGEVSRIVADVPESLAGSRIRLVLTTRMWEVLEVSPWREVVREAR